MPSRLGPADPSHGRCPRGRFVSSAHGPLSGPPRACAVCGTTETSQWRVGHQGASLCNADGIRFSRAARRRALGLRPAIARRRRQHNNTSPPPPPPPAMPAPVATCFSVTSAGSLRMYLSHYTAVWGVCGGTGTSCERTVMSVGASYDGEARGALPSLTWMAPPGAPPLLSFKVVSPRAPDCGCALPFTAGTATAGVPALATVTRPEEPLRSSCERINIRNLIHFGRQGPGFE
jgi:hypothetical protein